MKNQLKNMALHKAKTKSQISAYYKEFQRVYQTSLPDLVIRFQHSQTDTSTMRVVNFYGPVPTCTLIVDEIGVANLQIDLKAVCWHEFTHILDCVACVPYKLELHSYYSSISEIHAAHNEMQCRLLLSKEDLPSEETSIPVLSHTESVQHYMSEVRSDIIAFYSEAKETKNVDVAARCWKHLLYFCGYYLCLRTHGIQLPISLDPIPKPLYMTLLNCGIAFLADCNAFTSPTDETTQLYQLAEKTLFSIII